MKVFIITEGGKDIGFGHITRCISLYQAFEEREIIPEFVVNGDDVISDLLKDKNYRIFNWLKEKNKIFELVKNVDVTIVDSYLADISFYETLSKLVKILVYIDDIKRLDYPKGIVVNGSIYAKELNYPEKKGITYLLGTKYIPLRREFWNIPEKKINKEVKNVLITFGGMNHSALIYKVINYLKNKFDFNFHTVEPEQNRLSAKEILDLMLKADICVSGGGQTTYELARVGVPTIGICFVDNQKLNLEGWQERKFIEFVGWWKDENVLDNVMTEMNLLMSRFKREEKSKIGRQMVDGKGARRVCDLVMKKGRNI